MADHISILDKDDAVVVLNADDCGADGKTQGVKLLYSADGVATPVTADGSGLEVQLGAALPAGAALVGKVGIDQTTPGTTNKVSIGSDGVVGLGAGTNAIGKLAANDGVDIGDVDVKSLVPGTGATALGKAEDAAHSSGDVGVEALAVRTDTPAASSGTTGDYEPLHTNKSGGLWTIPLPATPFKNIDCDETEDAISANPCILRGFYAYANVVAGTKRYIKLYNATTANVTVGTTVPVMTFELDGTQGIVFSTPLLFSTALTVAATTGLADNDTGAPGANEVIISGGYSDL